MPDKRTSIKIVGPVLVVPGADVQQVMRTAVLEQLREASDGEHVTTAAIQHEMVRRTMPRHGFLVASTGNTLDVAPGDLLSRARVLELIAGPHDVTLTAPKSADQIVAQAIDAWEALK